VLGGYHNFMIPAGFGFHKVWYLPDRVLPQKNEFFTLVKGINICLKKQVLAMLVLRNLRTAGSPLSVLTNQVLLFF